MENENYFLFSFILKYNYLCSWYYRRIYLWRLFIIDKNNDEVVLEIWQKYMNPDFRWLMNLHTLVCVMDHIWILEMNPNQWSLSKQNRVKDLYVMPKYQSLYQGNVNIYNWNTVACDVKQLVSLTHSIPCTSSAALWSPLCRAIIFKTLDPLPFLVQVVLP